MKNVFYLFLYTIYYMRKCLDFNLFYYVPSVNGIFFYLSFMSFIGRLGVLGIAYDTFFGVFIMKVFLVLFFSIIIFWKGLVLTKDQAKIIYFIFFISCFFLFCDPFFILGVAECEMIEQEKATLGMGLFFGAILCTRIYQERNVNLSEKINSTQDGSTLENLGDLKSVNNVSSVTVEEVRQNVLPHEIDQSVRTEEFVPEVKFPAMDSPKSAGVVPPVLGHSNEGTNYGYIFQSKGQEIPDYEIYCKTFIKDFLINEVLHSLFKKSINFFEIDKQTLGVGKALVFDFLEKEIKPLIKEKQVEFKNSLISTPDQNFTDLLIEQGKSFEGFCGIMLVYFQQYEIRKNVLDETDLYVKALEQALEEWINENSTGV